MIESEERIRVLVVGESAITRAGLESALASNPRFELVGSTNAEGSAALFDATGAEAVLMESGTFREWSAGPGTTFEPSVATPLSPREIEVLRMIADGESNKVIAWKLGISDHTVKFHVTSILNKLNAGSRTEAVTRGVRMGLIYL